MATSEQIQEFERAVLNSDVDQDWNYLSEGNKHIVFQCTETNGILNSLVLNINKDPHESEDTFASNYIAQRWLGDEYITKTIHPIYLPYSFVVKLINKIQEQRPLKRKKKHPFESEEAESKMNKNDNPTAIDVLYTASLDHNATSLSVDYQQISKYCGYAQCNNFEMPSPKRRKRNRLNNESDHDEDNHSTSSDSESKREIDNDSIESILTFDMKPKWMFLNLSPFIDDNNIKKSICRFGMHQQSKLNKSKSIQSISKYCPLSLLSNDIDIVATNIQHLLDAKQTNFKVFSKDKEIECYELIKEHDVQIVASVIVKHNELFKKISMLQRLDKFDIEVVYKIWNELKIRNKLQMIDDFMKDTKILDEIINELNVEFNETEFDKERSCICNDIDKIKQCIKNHKLCNNHDKEMNEFIEKSTDKQLLMYISEYLISSIFKDCQVLITIDFNNTDRHKITVIDLHSKPMDRIENKWLKQDIGIVQNYINLMTK